MTENERRALELNEDVDKAGRSGGAEEKVACAKHGR
jgi:hypothetical protein